MSTPLANKTTISSRNKIAPNTMQPPSRIARNRVLQRATPAAVAPPPPRPTPSSTSASSRIASLASTRSDLSMPDGPKVRASLLQRPTPLASRQSNIISKLNIPDTNVARKGLARFSNPIECQRMYQNLTARIEQLEGNVTARIKERDELQARLKQAVDTGIGYATTVQYFAMKLKLDFDTNIMEECEQLKSRNKELLVKEQLHESRLEAVELVYKDQLQVELDLRKNIEKELEQTRVAHSEYLQRLTNAHKNELDDLNNKHSTVESELRARIGVLESDFNIKCKELTELRKEYEVLDNSYKKLEDSLTKDKDARVKYVQEKMNLLQKEVDSLNSVLEMRLERIHTLEKDGILLAEAHQELESLQDTNKALSQQLESLNAALDKRREQYENLIVETEKVRQELKQERKERRRMTMKTEQLEYVLNESCATESNMAFNSSIRDLDSADHIV